MSRAKNFFCWRYSAKRSVGALLLILFACSCSQKSFEWMQAEVGPTKLSSEVFTQSDLPGPVFSAIVGKAKFVRAAESKDLKLGYMVELSIEPVNLSLVPERYRSDRRVEVQGRRLTQLGLTDVTHEIVFTLVAKDIDGFVLATTESERHTISSGQQVTLQGLSSNSFADSVAKRIVEIELSITVTDCLSCEP